MFATVRKIILTVLFFSLIVFAVSRLFVQPRSAFRDASIVINDYPMTTEEFTDIFNDLQLEDDSAAAKEAFLNNLINRKLILQEAQALELDKKTDFLKSIERFWEQSLLKLILDRKVKEIRETITISEAEVNSLYAEWLKANPGSLKSPHDVKETLKEKIIRDAQTEQLDAWINSLRSKARIHIDRKDLGIE
jgi:hypothetical protein